MAVCSPRFVWWKGCHFHAQPCAFSSLQGRGHMIGTGPSLSLRHSYSRFHRLWSTTSSSTSEDQPPSVEGLAIPADWTSHASAESEWLRVALHQWLDDEFCPEPANEEISKRCSKVYYLCLMENQLDVGDVLLQMVRELEPFSFKESFHGAFSAANAAVDLIVKKIYALEGKQ